ncbi:MAG: hypothetical protein AAB846_01030 [Patescibacteria group bacterium]
MGKKFAKVYGVVDIGTLKVKAEIASVEPDGLLEKLYSSNVLTLFGTGLDENGGMVQEQYIRQTIDELQRLKGEFKKHGVEKSRVVSTHAMRKAKNREDIVERIKKEVGFDVENITQEQEAEFFFRAVMQTFAPENREYAVIDVGGGSVQVLVGTKKKLQKAHMMKTGTVSLHEKFVQDPHNPRSFSTEDDIEQMRLAILEELMPFERAKNVPLVYGSSMVIDIMKQIDIQLYPHKESAAHPYKTYAGHLAKVIKEVGPMPFGERDELYKLPHHYAWGLDKAFLNAVTIAEHFESPHIIPSNANIAQGIIYSMAEA